LQKNSGPGNTCGISKGNSLTWILRRAYAALGLKMASGKQFFINE